MYEKQNKKLSIVNILDILNKYSDPQHTLSQADIQKMLKDKYDMELDRKAIKRNLMNLEESGANIKYKTLMKTIRNKYGEEEPCAILTDFYMDRPFSDAELRLLVDSVLFAKNIPMTKSKDLIKKLIDLSSVHFENYTKYVSKISKERTDNEQVFQNISLLSKAIKEKKKIVFNYLEYRSDKKLHLRRREDNTVREYVMSPYMLAVNEGMYFLICNKDDHDDIANYRVDRIANIRITDEKRKQFDELVGADGKALDINEYMRKHIYMYSGSGSSITFRIDKKILTDIIDIFGKKVTFCDETDTHITVTTDIAPKNMIQFALKFAPYVKVISPKSLQNEIKELLKSALENYDSDE